jgi:hypothetical protein
MSPASSKLPRTGAPSSAPRLITPGPRPRARSPRTAAPDSAPRLITRDPPPTAASRDAAPAIPSGPPPVPKLPRSASPDAAQRITLRPPRSKSPRPAAPGPAPRLITPGPPPEWRYGELTVVIGGARAELRYARESVGSSSSEREAIAAAVLRALDRLADRSRPPDELLPALAAAYAAVLRRRGARPGDRVPLVELRDELGGTRAQFAWDLARLRRERRLVVDGRRLDLGVATGHTAARRSQVVWIENDGGGGSFFQTFRLIAQEVRS